MAPIPPLRGGSTRINPPRNGPGARKGIHGGKRVAFVTPYQKSAEEEAKKYNDRGQRTEIKKEKDDTGTYVYTVFVFEL